MCTAMCSNSKNDAHSATLHEQAEYVIEHPYGGLRPSWEEVEGGKGGGGRKGRLACQCPCVKLSLHSGKSKP